MSTTDSRPAARSDEPSTATIEVRSPSTGDVVDVVPRLSRADIDAAAQRLRTAQPAWEALGPSGRSAVLLSWLDWILDHEDRLVQLIQAEAGKATADAAIEVSLSVDVINYFTKHAEEFLADRHVRPASVANAMRKLRLQVRPYPLVGLITPWNAPLAGPVMDAVGALVAGAAVLSKPSEVTPLTWTEAVRGWNEDVGAPPVLFCANGAGETGAAVVDAVDMVMFTGSVESGRKIAARAGERLIPCSLELGGKDAMIVLSDADVDRAAGAAVWGAMNNVGQACVSVERVYVEKPVYDEFVSKVVSKVRALRVGVDDQDHYSTDVGSMVTPGQVDIVERHVKDAVAKGARVLVGGNRFGSNAFFQPTVLVDVDHTMLCMREETFGPTLPIMRVENEDEALRLANDSEFGLSSSIFTQNPQRADRLSRRIEAGSVAVNNALISAFQLPLPMGGWKQSGLGARFGGAQGVLKYCRQQSVVQERISLSSEPMWFPVSPTKGRVMAAAARLLGARDWRRKLGLKGRAGH